MAKKIDREAIEHHIRGILEALGDDPEREGLKDTPVRVARMYEEVFEGKAYDPETAKALLNVSTSILIGRCEMYSHIFMPRA